MIYALAGVAVLFGLLLLGRLGGARRRWLSIHGPALFFALAAGFALMRGAPWLALALAGAAFAAWALLPPPRRPAPNRADSEEDEARRVLGVQRGASREEIRAAFIARMRAAHPDQGGDTAEAARLAAARDRLLKGK